MEAKKFKTRMSKWIAGFYVGTLVFLLALMLFIPGRAEMADLEFLLFYAVFIIVFFVISYTLYRAYNLKITISDSQIEISGIYKRSKIKISEIKEVERTPIPFGFRLFGASFLGGTYYLPGIGKATVAMTNFSDGVLIKTKKGKNYVITPENPSEFIDSIKGRIE